jgi:hypothetical protein
MNVREKDTRLISRRISEALLLTISFSVALAHGSALAADSGQQLASVVQQSSKLMAEEFRASTRKLVVLPGSAPATGAVTGSYQKETLGMLDGMDEGRGYGTINKEIAGIQINFPIRILTVPGAIIGGLIGASARETQNYRDAMAENLTEAAESTLSNDALATDVFWRLHAAPAINAKVFALTTPIPKETEALLYISFSDFTIDVQKDDAILTMSASAALRRISDGVMLYENQVHYQDRDSLKNWIEDDSVAWKNFANYARHYLGREIAAEIIERAAVRSELVPRKSKTVSLSKKNAWQGVSKTGSPTIAWEHALEPDKSQAGWAAAVSGAEIAYELEIYDKQQLLYAARKIEETEFSLDIELPPCKTYRWSVRPSYSLGGDIRYGEWMRSNPDQANGNVGQAAAEAAAYIYDFASLEIKCGHR